MINQVT